MHRASARIPALPPDGDVGLLRQAPGLSEGSGPEAFALLPIHLDGVGLGPGPARPAECRHRLIAVEETVGKEAADVFGLVVPEHRLAKSRARLVSRVAPGTTGQGDAGVVDPEILSPVTVAAGRRRLRQSPGSRVAPAGAARGAPRDGPPRLSAASPASRRPAAWPVRRRRS